MKRKLIFDPEFKPISYTGDREREFFPNGIFLFDITALDEHIRSHQDEFVVTDVEVDRYYTDERVMGVKELKEEHYPFEKTTHCSFPEKQFLFHAS